MALCAMACSKTRPFCHRTTMVCRCASALSAACPPLVRGLSAACPRRNASDSRNARNVFVKEERRLQPVRHVRQSTQIAVATASAATARLRSTDEPWRLCFHHCGRIWPGLGGFVMEYCKLGGTGLTVSRLCLGTMTFGFQSDEETAGRIMESAADAGVTFFDTADVYPLGGDESRVGRTE